MIMLKLLRKSKFLKSDETIVDILSIKKIYYESCLERKEMILEIILGITTITFGYTSFNLFRKVERLEDWVEDYSQNSN